MNWGPSNEALAELGQRVIADNPGAAIEFKVEFGELSVLAEKNRIVELLTNLRDNPAFQFQQLMLLSGADYPHRAERFDVVYHLMSYTKNLRIRVTVRTDEDTPVPTVTAAYPNADWYEREAFDMYGIFFSGHPDLRRILTDYGFHGYPLRKDFPMSGYVEVRYDDEAKRVVYEPIKITEWRNWDFLSPWEGAEYARPGDGYAYKLPGDEKGEAK